ncbi:hypothetical protein CPB84DRAFT_1966778 [Gymnopilus junonius]|uniref:Uncharacterized protein n=1 Tax=Gymnopilus junonius TaxID=109634 RepID=A0A9P5TGM0_GYMJU|nr:hypothetical protein CPB84DRAFT_1966778 [Gymnopilus junonius]
MLRQVGTSMQIETVQKKEGLTIEQVEKKENGLVANVLYMYHGKHYRIDPAAGLPLAAVIDEIEMWMSAHTAAAAAITVQIKQDAPPSGSVISFATAVTIGIDVTAWGDNNPNFDIYTPSGVHLVIQDEYSFDEGLSVIIVDKWDVVDGLLNAAFSDPDPTTCQYLNFASATTSLK